MSREHATLGELEETYEHIPSGPDLCKSCFNTFHAALADVLKTVFTKVKVVEEK
jgi:hypothetical protein